MRLTVDLGPGLAQFEGRMRAVPGKARLAMADGLNEGGDLQATAQKPVLVGQMGTKGKGPVTKRMRKRRASPGRLDFDITGTGRGLPIQDFPVTVGAHVIAMPWRVAHDFGPRSFRSKVKGLLRRRVGSSRMPIEGFNGPSVAKEIVKDASAAEFEGHAAKRVERCVLKRLGRMLP